MVTIYRIEYRDRAESFIRKVIQHRRLLISQNISTINKMKALLIMEKIDQALSTTNFTNRGIARFFLKHADDIKYLIKHDDVLKHNDFNRLYQLSQTYQYL